MEKDTLGKIATDLMAKDEPRHNVIDMQRAMQQDYEKELIACMNDGKKRWHADFYVVVMTKTERTLKNVIRNFFFSRQSCPTPTYDNTVYKYNAEHDMLEFLWVLPSKETCEAFRDDPLATPPEERDLLNFVLEFYDGALDIRAKKLNGEELVPLF